MVDYSPVRELEGRTRVRVILGDALWLEGGVAPSLFLTLSTANLDTANPEPDLAPTATIKHDYEFTQLIFTSVFGTPNCPLRLGKTF